MYFYNNTHYRVCQQFLNKCLHFCVCYAILNMEVCKLGINEYIKIGSRIKELRKSKGFTQREMADMLNLSYSTYSNYENNHREPKIEIIEKAAEILGVTIIYLIGHDSSSKLEKDYYKKQGVFVDYLYSLGYSVETPLDSKEYPSNHFIGYDNRSKFKVVDAKSFKKFQEESNNYIIYLMNNLLEQSIDLDEYMNDEDF